MRTRTITFEELPMEPLEIEVEYSYYYDAGKYSGRPEDCYSEEEDGEAVPPKNIVQIVTEHYARLAQQALKQIETEIEETDIETIRQWAEEDSEIDEMLKED